MGGLPPKQNFSVNWVFELFPQIPRSQCLGEHWQTGWEDLTRHCESQKYWVHLKTPNKVLSDCGFKCVKDMHWHMWNEWTLHIKVKIHQYWPLTMLEHFDKAYLIFYLKSRSGSLRSFVSLEKNRAQSSFHSAPPLKDMVWLLKLAILKLVNARLSIRLSFFVDHKLQVPFDTMQPIYFDSRNYEDLKSSLSS